MSRGNISALPCASTISPGVEDFDDDCRYQNANVDATDRFLSFPVLFSRNLNGQLKESTELRRAFAIITTQKAFISLNLLQVFAIGFAVNKVKHS